MKPACLATRRRSPHALIMFSLTASLGLSLAACTEPTPRTYLYFMEDKIAREGTLARCDTAPQDGQQDIECANARRAEMAVALQLERERREVLQAESDRKIADLTRRISEREALAREAAREALRADREAYEAIWRERLQQSAPTPAADGVDSAPAVVGSTEPGAGLGAD
jgi:hypothetical protein